MTEYIEREAAIKNIKENQCRNCSDIGLCGNCAVLTAIKLFENIPAADILPVVRGKWKKRMEEKEMPYYKSFTPIWSCSECGTEYDPSLCMTINFCPNCGAKMYGGD